MAINKQYLRYLIIVSVLIGLGLVAYHFKIELAAIISILSEGSLDDVVNMIHTWGILAPLISIILMVFQAVVAPIPSFLITGANGIVFGLFGGIAISWIGAMIGAAATFYLARILGGKSMQKLGNRSKLLRKVDEISNRHGTKVVFIGRLLPFVSFDFLSYAAGLSTMKAIPFFIATGLGMLPGTIAYVLLGNQILALSRYSGTVTTIVVMGLAIIGTIILIRKKLKGDQQASGRDS
jgi:uncharacterized membrane protein YdjX (TVP38/TMEM64 family)